MKRRDGIDIILGNLTYFLKGTDKMIVKLNNVRLAFPNLFSPQSFEGGNPKFTASFILPKNHPACKELEKAMAEVAEAKWGSKAKATLEQLKKSDRVCFRDGSDKSQYAGFEGNMYVAASNDARPLVMDRDKTELSQADGKPYAGCYVNTSVELWAQDNKFGKRINASLRGVQFLKDGDAFAGGAPASPDEFDDLGEGAEVEEDLA